MKHNENFVSIKVKERYNSFPFFATKENAYGYGKGFEAFQ